MAVTFPVAIDDPAEIIAANVAAGEGAGAQLVLIVIRAKGAFAALEGNAAHRIRNGQPLAVFLQSDEIAALRLSPIHAAMDEEELQM